MPKEKRIHRSNWFQPNNGDAIAAYMEKMARKGWLLEKADRFYTFRAIEPAELIFSVTYFPNASVFDPRPAEPQQTYLDYCREAGWELAASCGPQQIFYNRNPDPVPIETDEARKFSAICKSMVKTLVLPNAVLLACLLYYFYLLYHLFSIDPLYSVCSIGFWCLVGSLILLLLQSTYLLVNYGVWYLRSKKAIGQGRGCVKSTAAVSVISRITYAFSFLMVLFMAVVAGQRGEGQILTLIPAYALFYSALIVLLRFLKKHGKDRSQVKWFYIAIGAILCVAFYMVVWPGLSRPYGGDKHSGIETQHFSSPFGTYRSYDDYRYNAYWPDFSYKVVEIGNDKVRQFCWEKEIASVTARFKGLDLTLAESVAVEPVLPGALKCCYIEWGSRYVLLYDDRIVIICPKSDWEIPAFLKLMVENNALPPSVSLST
ncbi:MAG: DUF2812 domain-containing protein [Clostridiales bacterium]|nr:DUF2812 domain-containing protein [Clostridiales bacterium]